MKKIINRIQKFFRNNDNDIYEVCSCASGDLYGYCKKEIKD